jgi:NADPH:quinone reductase-like Zn-dependent oxidoreductase
MPQAVRFDHYGGIDVLQVEEVDRPTPGTGQVLVRVKAAGINPGEAKIRSGALAERWPATFPSGQGTDLAGIITETGPEAHGLMVGDEVMGFTHNRASHAEFAVVDAANLVPRPAHVSWEAAGSLFVAGTTAYAAVRAVAAAPGDTLVVAGAAGGVGSIAAQLGVRAGATVIGLASEPNHQWLAGHGVTPVAYGTGAAQRIRAACPGRVDAFIDTVGTGYVELALELGVAPARIDTIADFAARAKYGVKTVGTAAAARADVLAELAAMIDKGQLEIPIARAYRQGLSAV